MPSYEPLRDIVSQTSAIIKSAFVITQLKKDLGPNARARYKIFESYILEHELHKQHPEIKATMRQFGMLAASPSPSPSPSPPAAAAAAAPQSTLAQRLDALRKQIRKPSNSNNNKPSNNSGKITHKKRNNSSGSSNKKKTVKSHSNSD